MPIIGVDYHPSFQQIAFFDQETSECGERRLNHSDGEAEKFYRELQQRRVSVRVEMEATGYSRWFERLLAELGIEVWMGDAAHVLRKIAALSEHSANSKCTQQSCRRDRSTDVSDHFGDAAINAIFSLE